MEIAQGGRVDAWWESVALRFVAGFSGRKGGRTSSGGVLSASLSHFWIFLMVKRFNIVVISSTNTDKEHLIQS